MSEQEIIDGNILIAPFAGFKNNPPLPTGSFSGRLKHWEHNGKWYENSDLQFHSSWDWIMPVVEKIESLGFIFTIHSDAAYIGKHWYKGNFPHIGMPSETKIIATWKIVVEFIKWYKTQTT